MSLNDTQAALVGLSRQLSANYRSYLRAHDIQEDDAFYMIKVIEEVGELSAAFLVSRGQRPVKAAISMDEEAADALCQVLLLIERLKLDVWPHIEAKWLGAPRSAG